MDFFKAVCVLYYVCISGEVLSQRETVDMVSVAGTIIDAATGHPVEASIKYESLPYGNKIGVFSGSSFLFNVVRQHDYMLKITAEGYAMYHERLNISALKGNEIRKQIALYSVTGNQLIRLDKLTFAMGEAEISDNSYYELDNLVEMLNKNINLIIQLEGHTDFRGNKRQNMKLSEKRVAAVKKYLVENGIARKRIKTKAFGGEQPLTRESDASARKTNRRVEVRILKRANIYEY